ncbi:MAG: bifunctional alpha,alpha-trehalose-phosphate synthase (UDP-forming)/trehalose-phosphatase [Planctomycetes bacterium]|jgi:trehalose 6-phosphate synthase/phosphatase|nr:bifunctional alpha,alpha-trehalose-phosphate synthase (UDP-forming)/trehalose-phosphatase [Planctomycetota bacterium]
MRLLVVSNRLPVVTVEEKGQLLFREGAGGLVSGISAYLDSLRGSSLAGPQYRWIGWPGVTVAEPGPQAHVTAALARLRAHPVFLTDRSMDKFYHGFCNKTIWPLFHYFPSYVACEESFYAHYRCVNRIFCDAVAPLVQPDDVVWIHDYHLMLLPQMLREQRPDATIGFFLHIPFPSFEMFRLLPGAWRTEILEGLLGADLIGFHTYDYTQHFLHSVLRVLGHEHTMGRILLPNHLVKVDTFPMGVDFQKFQAAARQQVDRTGAIPDAALKDLKVVLSVDRLDYTKGILNRLQGYELFLEQNPSWQQNVVLVLVVVPSRIGVDQYQEIKRQIDELVGKINGKFGRVDWTPVLYQYRYLPFEPLVSLYARSHVALVTPLRDGMNLVAKEYLASRTDGTGVLIVSEMTGAAKELAEAVLINPNNVGEIAVALRTALEMPESEQMRRNEVMQERLRRYDVVRWADDFLSQLPTLKAEQQRLRSRLLGVPARRRLLDKFRQAPQRTIFLDYDGTLVSFTDHPRQARPSRDLLTLLRTLAQGAGTDVVLVSGRDKATMGDWFGDLDLALVAEHGAWIKRRRDNWRLAQPLNNGWKSSLLPILQTYADRLPGAFLEEKEYSIVWHYRRADLELASTRVKELVDDLVSYTANIDVQVQQGNRIVEVRCGGINKGVAALTFLPKEGAGFVLAIGDDWTDEELFRALPVSACTLLVGNRHTWAKYNLRNHEEVLELLREMSERQLQECGS